MICAARESGAKRTDKGTAGESRCRKAMGLNGASRTTAGLPKTENSPSSGPQGQEGGFFMREKKFGKLFLTWLLAATMVLTLLPVGMLAADDETDHVLTVGEQQDEDGSGGGISEGNGEGEEPPTVPEYAAKIVETGGMYQTVAMAIAAAGAGQTVELLKDVTESITISKSLTLDLNGKTLTGDGMDSVVTITGENTIVTIMSSALNEDESVKNGSITGGVGSKDHNFCFGGGVFIVDATVTLSNLTISKNCADREYDETANYDRTGGGGIASVKANLTLNNVTVTNNYTKNCSGGGGICTLGGILTINNATIANNKSDDEGGGIFAENTVVEIQKAVIRNNCASLAGGIYIVNDEDIINVGENYQLGTKVVNIPDKDSVISYATIESNTASSIGGGLYIGGQNELTISNSTISGNNGSAQGGGIVAYSPAELVLDNTDVFQNEAAAGAGLFAYATASGNTRITLKNKTAFMNNTADGFGGGLYIQKLSGNQPVVDIENSALYNNTAATAGDDLLLSGATYTLPVASQMPGDKKLASDGEDITGWYHDGWYKWNPTANDGKGSYEEIGRWTVDTADEYKPVANDSQAISLKAAHAQMFTVTYTDGVDNEEVFKDQVYKVAKDSATPAFDDNPTRSGYTFMGWSPAVTETVTADITYTAQWKRIYRPTPPTPTVEIPDDDALGLNTDDHFAYIIGYPDGTVQPNGQITRAEATTIFFRLLTEESRSANLTKTNGYTDVASDAWYNTAVSTMTKAGIVDGYPDGTFRPDAPITRAEMAKIISLFAKLDKSESRFSDIAGHWAEAYIKLAAGNGWIAGYPDGTFAPQRNITRAETATMINRVLDRVPSEESHLLSRGVMQIWPDANPGDWFYLAMQEATNSHDYERNAKWAAADEQWTALRETRDWKALEQ